MAPTRRLGRATRTARVPTVFSVVAVSTEAVSSAR